MASFRKRYTYQEVYDLIAKIGHTLLDKEYKNGTTKMNILCSCGEQYQMTRNMISDGYHHCDNRVRKLDMKVNVGKRKVLPRLCKTCNIEFTPKKSIRIYCSQKCSYKRDKTDEDERNERDKKVKERKTSIPKKECLFCKQIYQPLRNSSILCSLKCSQLYQQTDEYKNRAKKWGVKAGLASVKAQQRRSKNEIYFAQLCEQYFGKDNVKVNQPIFDGWDADIIIPSLNLAIGWNGIWHYQQISKTQSLQQVQSRDNIKQKIIENHGFSYYIIKDMGKYNPAFVHDQFETLLLMRICI